MAIFDFLSDVPIIGDVLEFVDDNFDAGDISRFAGAAGGYLAQGGANEMNLQISRENSAFNAQQAEINRGFESNEAQRQMEFQQNMVNQQERFQTGMSNTSYQRAMADMQAAGLNPMLAYSQGGASTPGGASAPGARGSGSAASAAPAHPMLSKYAAGASAYASAQEIQKRDREIKLLDQEYDIKRPLQEAGKGLGPLVGQGVEGVNQAVKLASDKLSEAVQAVQEAAPHIKGAAAAALDKVTELAQAGRVKLDEVLSAPGKLVERLTSTASQAHARAKASAGSIPFRIGADKIVAGSFSGDRFKDLKDIAGIKDPAERRRAMMSYRMWKDKSSR